MASSSKAAFTTVDGFQAAMRDRKEMRSFNALQECGVFNAARGSPLPLSDRGPLNETGTSPLRPLVNNQFTRRQHLVHTAENGATCPR